MITTCLHTDQGSVIVVNHKVYMMMSLQRLPSTPTFEGFSSVCLNLSFRGRQSTVSMVFHAL